MEGQQALVFNAGVEYQAANAGADAAAYSDVIMLKQQRANVAQQVEEHAAYLGQIADAALQQMAALDLQAHDSYASLTPDSLRAQLAESLGVVSSTATVRGYLEALCGCAETLKDLEVCVRDIEVNRRQDFEALKAAWRSATGLLSSASSQHQQALDQAAGALQLVPRLAVASDYIGSDLQRLTESIRASITEPLQATLQQVNWQGMLMTSAGQQPFAGVQDPGTLARLIDLLAALTMLQIAAQPAEFGRLLSQEQQQPQAGAVAPPAAASSSFHTPPNLWAVQQLTQPVTARLAALCDPSSSASTLDPLQPQQVFAVATALLDRHAQHVEPLQPALAAAGLGAHCNVVVEFTRGVCDIVTQLLAAHFLPAWHDHDDDSRAAAANRGRGGAAAAAAAAAGGEQYMPYPGRGGGAPPPQPAAAAAARGANGAFAGFLSDEEAAAAARAARQALWLSVLPVFRSFDRTVAPYLGVVLLGGGDDDEAGGGGGGGGVDGDVSAAADAGPPPEALLACSCLRAVTQHPQHMAAWLAAEGRSAGRQAEALLYEDGSWEPAASVLADSIDYYYRAAAAGRGGAALASSCEFYPPVLAEKAWGLLEGIVDGSRHLPTADAQREYLDAVAGSVIAATQARIARLLEQAATFRDVLSAEWAPRVAAALNAARYLEHHLNNMATTAPALHRLITATTPVPPRHGAGAAAAYSPAAGSSPGGGSGGAPSSASASPAAAGAAAASAAVAAAAAPVQPAVFKREVEVFAGIRREWCLRLSKAVATSFSQQAQPYFRSIASAYASTATTAGSGTDYAGDAGLDSVAGTAALPPVVLALLSATGASFGSAGGGGGGGAGAGGIDVGSVTHALLPAVRHLQDQLSQLAALLDAPSFMDVWRAVAVVTNRLMFNNVATEAAFSDAGARQFCCDCAALLAVFRPFTPRPAAHFKELAEAGRLLALPPGAALRLLDQLAATPNREDAAELLAAGVPGGVRTLPVDFGLLLLQQRATVAVTPSQAAAAEAAASEGEIANAASAGGGANGHYYGAENGWGAPAGGAVGDDLGGAYNGGASQLAV